MNKDPIEHVVLLMMENHSFDQMLGSLKRFDPDVDGVDAAHPGTNADASGRIYAQKETTEIQMNFDPRHEHVNVLNQLSANNGNFVRDFAAAYPSSSEQDRQDIMGYYPLDFLPALHALAKEYTICDRWFSSLPGPTWPNRYFALSGTSSGQVKMFNGLNDRNFAAWDDQGQPTIFDQLNKVNRRWRVYFYDFPQSFLLRRQRQPENSRNYFKVDDFFRDAQGPIDQFPEFVFIEPKYFGEAQNDDHPPYNTMRAEKLIADVYNALRANDPLWQSTLLIVVYDEHGGFYDHVAPPSTDAPDDKASGDFQFDRLGVRVPALLVSPWVGRRVEHTVFDHTSVLKYLCEKWNLAPDSLGRRVASNRTNSVGVALQSTRREEVRSTRFIRVSNASLIADRPDLEKSALNEHQMGLHAFADYLEMLGEVPLIERTGIVALSFGTGLGAFFARLFDRCSRYLAGFADRASRLLMVPGRNRDAKTAAVANAVIGKSTLPAGGEPKP